MNFLKEKPNEPCVFICRTMIRGKWDYNLYRIEKINSGDDTYYLGWMDNNGDEYGDLTDLIADEYLIIEKLDISVQLLFQKRQRNIKRKYSELGKR